MNGRRREAPKDEGTIGQAAHVPGTHRPGGVHYAVGERIPARVRLLVAVGRRKEWLKQKRQEQEKKCPRGHWHTACGDND